MAQRCQELMKQSDVVLFMKGDRDTPRSVPPTPPFRSLLSRMHLLAAPLPARISRSFDSPAGSELTSRQNHTQPCRCGFSQKIVGILESEGIDYTTFDILQDEGVRQSAFFLPFLSSPLLLIPSLCHLRVLISRCVF